MTVRASVPANAVSRHEGTVKKALPALDLVVKKPVLLLRHEEFTACFGSPSSSPTALQLLGNRASSSTKRSARHPPCQLGRVICAPLSSSLSSSHALQAGSATAGSSFVPLSSLVCALPDDSQLDDSSPPPTNHHGPQVASSKGRGQKDRRGVKAKPGQKGATDAAQQVLSPLFAPHLLPPAFEMTASSSSSSSTAAAAAAALIACGSLSIVFVPRFDEPSLRALNGASTLHRRVAEALRICAECVNRDVLGGIHDQIPPGSSLVAAFAKKDLPLLDDDDEVSADKSTQSARKRQRRETAGDGGGSAPTWELVGLCVGRELNSAVRAHMTDEGVTTTCDTHPNRLSSSSSSSSSSSLPLVQESSLQRWASSITELGDVHCTGVICGVQLVWVAEHWLRLGIASAMVDAFRKNLVYGTIVPPQHVAFSQPTRMGKLFAQRYAARRDFLVFE